MPRSFRLVLALFVCFFGVVASAAEPTELVSETGYRIGGGDVIQVVVYGEDTLSGTYEVAQDGGIDFPLLGRVDTLGLAVDALDAALTEQLSAKYLRDPQVQLTMVTYGSQPVQVLGAVKKPGVFHLGGATTVLDILAEAGGVKEGGVSEVRIKHKDPSLDTITVKIEQLVGDPTANILLRAGDVILVSEGMVVYVSGEVSKPGAIPFSEGLTVTQAIARAGGTKRTAKMRDAYILRGSERIAINITKIRAGRAPDVGLMPNDQVILKESVF
jgi:polysaccharide export outer membrane protein